MYNLQGNSMELFLFCFTDYYRTDPKFMDRQVWANNVDPDQSDQGLRCFSLQLLDKRWNHFVQILGYLQHYFQVSEIFIV